MLFLEIKKEIENRNRKRVPGQEMRSSNGERHLFFFFIFAFVCYYLSLCTNCSSSKVKKKKNR